MSNLTPEQTACKEAGKRLRTQLMDDGFTINGVGLTSGHDGGLAIRLYVSTAEELSRVPATFDGYDVMADVVNDIVAYAK